MVRKTKTMAATVKEGKKFTKKSKAARTSTIQQTIAAKDQGFKKPKKSRKTKTMAETIGQKAPKKIKKSALPVRKAKKSKPAKA